ncbi:uncharacterized protein CC84DRAFT_1167638 [Paraphaeosphaeria sporulosa]|uniref:Uncharacterized protein n=1 Tax=Paraphaeosphaeria sporulosa TaxID=1460663 RepID=A0A177C1V9_9PLEO|nr:uncharacterized protein CC84DRAFT_1167638 [Paraphaeosphaeria sporulosa]OAG01436.1 hypothetical protein CC84DRAFT_1167638 [Paraphaeosphaeria sporulosa]
MARIAHAILGISRDSLRRPGIPTSIGLSKAMAFVVVCVWAATVRGVTGGEYDGAALLLIGRP